MIPEHLQDQASLYALGALSGDEAAAFVIELRASAELRDLVRELQQTSGLLVAALPAMVPPPRLKAAIFERIDAPAAASPQPTGSTRDLPAHRAPRPDGGPRRVDYRLSSRRDARRRRREEPRRGRDRSPTQVRPGRVGDADRLVQHRPRPAQSAPAGAAPGHARARRPRRLRAAVPDGPDPPRGLDGPLHRDPRGGAGRLPAVAAQPAVPGPPP